MNPHLQAKRRQLAHARKNRCPHEGRELLAGEVAARNLDTRKRWRDCPEHGAHCICEPFKKTVESPV